MIENQGKILTLEERIKINELLGSGLSFTQIGVQLNRSKTCISREVMRNGGRVLYDPHAAMEATHKRLTGRYIVGRSICLYFSDEQVEIIKHNLSLGRSLAQTAKLARMSRKRLRRWMNNHGVKSLHKRDQQAESDRMRLACLEEQVKILFEIIKEIKR